MKTLLLTIMLLFPGITVLPTLASTERNSIVESSAPVANLEDAPKKEERKFKWAHLIMLGIFVYLLIVAITSGPRSPIVRFLRKVNNFLITHNSFGWKITILLVAPFIPAFGAFLISYSFFPHKSSNYRLNAYLIIFMIQIFILLGISNHYK